jgi:hypothetical protein
MPAGHSFEKPRWLRDLLRFLPLKSQFVLSGNVRDLQASEAVHGVISAVPLTTALTAELRQAGYGEVLLYEPLSGFRVAPEPGRITSEGECPLVRLGLTPVNGIAQAGLDLLGTTLERFIAVDSFPIALVVDFASRLVVRSDALSSAEHQLFSRALVLSQTSIARPYGPKRQPFFNTILWVVDKEGDLPDWLVIDNPRVRHIPIAKPDHHARRVVAGSLIKSLPGGNKAAPEDLAHAESALVDDTEGLLLVDLNAIARLGRSEGVEFSAISDAVRRYKVGVSEDPWRKVDHSKIRDAAKFIRRRVKGQDHAITHMLDIVKRAVTGVGSSRRGGRPRGVAFLAGPTGVGKTELAKTITSLLFGDESAYIRFDMSEFSAEHSDQRLIGAPPGYVGYDVGGELTNAIREKPFSIVLFDEIEKAHPRILDKFLQVLDDGVLTSGRGDRVYFSEALIVFTSNLGIFGPDQAGGRVANVTPDDSFDTVKSRVRLEIENYFKLVLNRPEILNRIGENVIVFDFIRPGVAEQIFDQMVDSLLDDVAALGFNVTLSAESRHVIHTLCLSDLSNGGRGIRNKVEVHLLNPLSRALFDLNASPGSGYKVSGVTPGAVTTLELLKSPDVA